LQARRKLLDVRRRRRDDEEPSEDRWLVSYADFITLLFACFTTLYAISTIDVQKMGKMVVSMRASFDNNLFTPGSHTLSLSSGPGSSPSSREILRTVDLRGANTKEMALPRIQDIKREVLSGEKALGRLKRSLEELLSADIMRGRVQAHIEPRGLIVSLGEGGVFDSGSDQIKPEGKTILDTIASSLVSLDNQIRIEGHTDDVPIRNSKFPSNWELSTARATAMISYLITEFGLRPEMLSAAGYAEYRPAASNDTEEGRARNRRVDIVVLNPAAAEIEPR